MRVILMLLLPTFAFAQPTIAPWQVLSVVTADWNKDGQKDRAVLVGNPEASMADLYIYLGTPKGFELAGFVSQFAMSGSMWGQLPSLALNEGGSLLVHSLNIGMGRNRWEQVVTIAYRDNDFVLAGFGFQYHDSIDPDDNGSCELNILTGRGVFSVNSGPEQTLDHLSIDVMPITAWNMDMFPEEC
ncbi:MAG: hypothetical protein V3V13_04540 [Paracoccaceae bacterium]